MELTSENVHSVLMDSLFNDGEDTTSHVIGNGVMRKVGFNPTRLESHRQEIESLADQLPDEFKDGMSFLNACIRKDGQQWGEHSNIDELICLGTAIGKISYPFPREIWAVLPGGMPYIKVN